MNYRDFFNESLSSEESISQLLSKYPLDQIWLTSDWHVFKQDWYGVKTKDRDLKKLINQQKSIVKPNDIFIYLGDLTYKKLDDSYDDVTREFYNQLNGIKILVKGNHDLKSDDYYFSLGFNYVTDGFQFKNMIFSHRPVKLFDRKDHKKLLNIHGHIHGARVYFDSEKENHLDVYEDSHKPINLKKLLAKKDKFNDENIDVYDDNDFEKILNKNKSIIKYYSKLLDKFFKLYPKYKDLSMDKMYKLQDKAVLDFCLMPEVAKDEELIGWKCTDMQRKSGYDSLTFKPTSMKDYHHTVILNKDKEIIIDPFGILIGKPTIYSNGEHFKRFNWKTCYGFGYGLKLKDKKKEYSFPQNRVDNWAKMHNITLNENYILPEFDYKINLDQWRPGNPLYITGTSGDGKSTLANKLAKKYNAYLIHTDLFLGRICRPKEKYYKWLNSSIEGTINSNGSEMVLEYINQHPELPWFIDFKEAKKYWLDFFKWFRENAKNNPKYRNKLIIIEGCDICFIEPEIAVNFPLIIIGHSKFKTALQRIKRDMGEDHTLFDSIKRELKRDYIKPLNKMKSEFRKNLKKLK